MPTPDRRFVHQQDTATLTPAMLRDPLRPRRDQPHYLMPTDPFTAGHSTDRHHPHIGHQLPSQTPCELPLKLGMLLKMTLVTVPAHEPAPLPHQRHLPIPDPSVANPPRSHIMHQPGLEPAPPTTRHRPGRLDLHHKAADRVHQHIHHTDPSQLQPDRHNITSHRGPPEIGLLIHSPITAGPRPLSKDLRNRPDPTLSRSLDFEAWRVSQSGRPRRLGQVPKPS